MNLEELSAVFTKKGGFDIIEHPEGFLQIKLTIDGRYRNLRCYSWNEVAQWDKAIAIYESKRLYVELGNYIRVEKGPQEGDIWDIRLDDIHVRRCVVRRGEFVSITSLDRTSYALDDSRIKNKEFIL